MIKTILSILCLIVIALVIAIPVNYYSSPKHGDCVELEGGGFYGWYQGYDKGGKSIKSFFTGNNHIFYNHNIVKSDKCDGELK